MMGIPSSYEKKKKDMLLENMKHNLPLYLIVNIFDSPLSSFGFIFCSSSNLKWWYNPILLPAQVHHLQIGHKGLTSLTG